MSTPNRGTDGSVYRPSRAHHVAMVAGGYWAAAGMVGIIAALAVMAAISQESPAPLGMLAVVVIPIALVYGYLMAYRRTTTVEVTAQLVVKRTFGFRSTTLRRSHLAGLKAPLSGQGRTRLGAGGSFAMLFLIEGGHTIQHPRESDRRIALSGWYWAQETLDAIYADLDVPSTDDAMTREEFERTEPGFLPPRYRAPFTRVVLLVLGFIAVAAALAGAWALLSRPA